MPRLRALRDRIHRDICEHGFDAKQNTFTQAYNSAGARRERAPDAGARVLAGERSARAGDDARDREGPAARTGSCSATSTEHTNDGLAGTEGAFLACSFWLVDAYAYSGRRREAEALFERLIALRNDLGLLSEEYEPKHGRLIGNFPQAFSHLALIHSANVLGRGAS